MTLPLLPSDPAQELARVQVEALSHCRFAPGTPTKRFVRLWAARVTANLPITVNGLGALDKTAHAYRRQIGRCLAAKPCAACEGLRERGRK